MDSFKKMADDFDIDNDVKVSMLARCPEVLTMEDVRKMKTICGSS